MPGIFGFITKNELSRDKLIKMHESMSATLLHEDWYRQDSLINGNIAFGCITIKAPHKIYHLDHNGRSFLCFIDGYIYRIGNKPASGYADTKKLLIDVISIYSSGDPTRLVEIQGNYSIAIYCYEEKKLTLFNDIIGARRIYYTDSTTFFSFSPEIKAICKLDGFKGDLNWKAIADFFNYGYILGDDTFFSTIRSLPSASLVIYSEADQSISVEKYWQPKYEDEITDIEEAVSTTLLHLQNSLDEKTSEKDSIINPISGGLDSRIIFGLLNNVGKSLNILPITYGQKFSHEYKNATQVCKALSRPNHRLIEIIPEKLLDLYQKAVWLSEGMIAFRNCHLLLIYPELKNNSAIFFNGIYGGPTNYSAEYFAERHLSNFKHVEEQITDIASVISLSVSVYKDIVSNDLYESIQDNLHTSIANELDRVSSTSNHFCNRRDAFFIENRMRRLICQSALYRFYWEEKLPLCSYPLYFNYLSISPHLKLKRFLLKEMIKNRFPELARIRDSNTGCNLFATPGKLYRVKRNISNKAKYYLTRLTSGLITPYNRANYAHYNLWFKKHRPTFELFHNSIYKSKVLENGYINKQGMDTLFQAVKSGQAGFNHIERLTTFAIWHNLFVEN